MSGPIVGKRRLRADLRRLRRDRELTQDQVAAEMEWSLSKLIRIENGTVAISVSDLRSLLAYYQVPDQQRVDDLLELARAAKRRMWWDAYRTGLPPQLLTYVGFEAEATRISGFHPVGFPGLMQTERYAYAVGSADERQVEFQLRRQQELFSRAEPPQFVAVLDESVLRRQPAGDDEAILVDQIEHSIEFAHRPYATVRIMPFNAGHHPGWTGKITLLEFGDDDGVVYPSNGLDQEPDAVSEYRGIIGGIVDRALPPESSVDFMRAVASELKHG